MPADQRLQALRDASPRSQPGFEESTARYDAVRLQITTTPVPTRRPLPQRASRRRVIGLSAAAAATLSLAGVIVGLTLGATSPSSAFASARRALAATAAAASGTMTLATAHGGTTVPLNTTRWNGRDIAESSGPRHLLGLNQQLLLIGGGAYLQTVDGSWLHYTSESGVGPRLMPAIQLAHDNVTGSAGEQILALATGLHKMVQPDGTTVYAGTIPDSSADPVNNPTADAIMRMITNLRSGNEPGAPGGYHNDLQLRMTVGNGDRVTQISVTFQQHGTKSADVGPTTWSVTYSRLGSTPPITAPAASAVGTPGAGPKPAPTGTAPTTTAP
jgi:hypothetical protein